jgi:hypothetical protein
MRKPTPAEQPAKPSLTQERSPVLLQTTAVRVYVAELRADAPSLARAGNPAQSVGRTRREALRRGDWTARALPWLVTRRRWLVDKDAESYLFVARWLETDPDLPALAAESARALITMLEATSEAVTLLFRALDQANGEDGRA